MSIENKTICHQRKTFLVIFLRSIIVKFFYRTFGRTSKIAKTKVTSILAAACDQVTLRVLILTTHETKDASVTKCRQYTGFLSVCSFFLSSVIKSANLTERSAIVDASPSVS